MNILFMEKSFVDAAFSFAQLLRKEIAKRETLYWWFFQKTTE